MVLCTQCNKNTGYASTINEGHTTIKQRAYHHLSCQVDCYGWDLWKDQTLGWDLISQVAKTDGIKELNRTTDTKSDRETRPTLSLIKKNDQC